MIYDFDRIIDRYGTDSVKYDNAEERGKSADLIPLWVADMDFPAPQEVLDALTERVRHGIFGYTDPSAPYYDAVRSWFERHHGYAPSRSWIVLSPGVVYALATAVAAFTEPGDGVLIQPPVYYPFREVVEDGGRTLVRSPLVFDGEKYAIDFDDFEACIEDNDVKLCLLCNPHNPVGRVWTPDELRRLGEICLDHDVIVVSDEIHADFARPGHTHTVFASLSPRFEKRCVTCTAPSKTFNLAGLQASNVFIADPDMRARFKTAIKATGQSSVNVLGLTAAQAAYEHGDDWLRQVKDYLEGNLEFVKGFLADFVPELRVVEPESTYLIWIDCNDLGLTAGELYRMVEHDAKLWVDEGTMFGLEGSGFIRINIACPRAILEVAFEQLAKAVRTRMDA